MRFYFVTVPMFCGEPAEAAFNAFAASYRVLAKPSRGFHLSAMGRAR